jgi:hypothetical protein
MREASFWCIDPEGCILRYLLASACFVLISSGAVFAQTAAPNPAQTAQQDRMRNCNASASDRSLKGEARKSFMSACLGNKQTPQVMMKVCNAEATQDSMTADVRKTYLSTCLSSNAAKGS